MPALTTIETPVPLVDLDRLGANLDRMANYARTHALSLRPHVKTHKSPFVARQQIARGAIGVTCATPREVEVMSAVTDNILLAHPLLGAKLDRLRQFDPSVHLSVMLDSREAIDELAAAAGELGRQVSVLLEVDTGLHRMGVRTPDELVSLAQHLTTRKELHYAGIGFYPGHVRAHVQEQDTLIAELSAFVEQMCDTLARAGLPPGVVSGGSTPTAFRTHEIHGVTEMRPGTYVYNDRTTAEIGACSWDDCALTVLATVISTTVPGQVIVDAGTKALGREPLRARGQGDAGYGCLLDRPDVVVTRMSEEHGIIELSNTDWRPRVGDQVRIIPNHVCIVTHLNDIVYGIRGTDVETSWAIEARGRVALPFQTTLAGQ